AHPGTDTGFGPGNTGLALSTLADAPVDVVPLGARLDVLHALARADLPDYDKHEAEYVRLAASIGAPHGLDAQTILDDLKAVAQGDQDLAATPTGQTLPHHATAFVGDDVCHTARVRVDGKPAAWIFSEFETDAPFADLADWANPRTWPTRAPLLFKKMDLVGGFATLTGIEADPHWRGDFLEEVLLVDRLRTNLDCAYFVQPGRAVGMTYDLISSVDDQITVDRGFLLATDIGGGYHRVKALKIVGFRDQEWDTVAQFVCPMWTDWVRQAVRGGTTSTPKDPGENPTPTTDPGGPQTPPGPTVPEDDVLDEWVDFFAEAAKTYAHLVSDVARKSVAGGYKLPDMARDGARYWSQLAKDWSRAWAFGLEMMQDMAEDGPDVTLRPPDPDRSWRGGRPDQPQQAGYASAAASQAAMDDEGTTVPIPASAAGSSVTVSDLASIGAGGATIPSSGLTVTPTTLGDGTPALRLTVRTSESPPGLYVGRLTVAGGPTVPVQIYVSRAVAGSP
nr:hypothetical protein [Acidimicrobiia bacterium]